MHLPPLVIVGQSVQSTVWRAVLLCGLGLFALIARPAPDEAMQLRAQHLALAQQLTSNSFGRPLVLESRQTSGEVAGDVFAVLDAPFAAVRDSLSEPGNWCEIMLLHLNNRRCQVRLSGTRPALAIELGKKVGASLVDTFKLNLDFGLQTRSSDYLAVHLVAADGPLGTHDYRVVLQAVSLPSGQTFVHLGYAYGYGLSARLAMQAYLLTVGHNKVGFSLQSADAAARPVTGMRGAVERNTMRYYLAIEVFMATRELPAQAQLPRRWQAWFEATENYHRQLHEMDLESYLSMKRQDRQAAR